jgi:NADH dehydrogenase
MRPRGICVLGGTGFVGRALASRLARDGHTLRVLTRDPERARALWVLPTVQLVRADVHDPAVLVREFRGVDAVINLVGILNERGRDGSGFYRVHTELTQKIVQACRTSAVPVLLQMSGLNADSQRGPSHYLRSKGLAEDYIRERCVDGPQWAIIKPSVIFGPGDAFINKFATLLRLVPPPLLLPLACATAQFAPAYVEDVAEATATWRENPNRLPRDGMKTAITSAAPSMSRNSRMDRCWSRTISSARCIASPTRASRL